MSLTESYSMVIHSTFTSDEIKKIRIKELPTKPPCREKASLRLSEELESLALWHGCFPTGCERRKKMLNTLNYCGLKHARCVSTISVLASLNSPPTMIAITWVQITRLVISSWGCYNSIYSSIWYLMHFCNLVCRPQWGLRNTPQIQIMRS